MTVAVPLFLLASSLGSSHDNQSSLFDELKHSLNGFENP